MSSFFDRIHEEAHKLKEKIKEKSRKRKAPTAEEAIGNLKDAEDLLVKKQEYFEERIQQEVETAKKYSKTNKKMALAALRRKKHHEQELTRIDGVSLISPYYPILIRSFQVLTKLEAQRAALENVGIHNEVIDVLGKTNETLKKEHAKMDLDQVHDLMDEIADGLAMSDELSEAISAPIGDVADEEELLQELQELQDVSYQLSYDIRIRRTPMISHKLPIHQLDICRTLLIFPPPRPLCQLFRPNCRKFQLVHWPAPKSARWTQWRNWSSGPPPTNPPTSSPSFLFGTKFVTFVLSLMIRKVK